MKNKSVICRKCGEIDRPTKQNVGTYTIMICEDCADQTGHASLCRKCCPSGHETHFKENE